MISEEVSGAVTILSKTRSGPVLRAHASDHVQTGSVPAFRGGLWPSPSCGRRFFPVQNTEGQNLSWTRVNSRPFNSCAIIDGSVLAYVDNCIGHSAAAKLSRYHTLDRGGDSELTLISPYTELLNTPKGLPNPP